jgi:hypothetical protein
MRGSVETNSVGITNVSESLHRDPPVIEPNGSAAPVLETPVVERPEQEVHVAMVASPWDRGDESATETVPYLPGSVDHSLEAATTRVAPCGAHAFGKSELESAQPAIGVCPSISGGNQLWPRLRWYQWPWWLAGRSWDLSSLCLLIAIVAAVPVIQFASLGYLLYAAGNLANGKPWRTALPGLRTAGKLGTFALFAAVTWLPVFVMTDLAYSAQLLQPSSAAARGWRAAAFVFAFAWVVYVGWAAVRGGRWWNFLWPAPLRFVQSIWQPRTWSRASDELYDLVTGLQFPRLWWLGVRASVGALLWTCIPVSLMIIGERAQDFKLAGLVGLVGAVGMTIVMLYLPMLQVHMAARDRFAEIFNVQAVRRGFAKAPWFYAASIFVLCALAIPLYLLRIEATPSQLVWAPSLVFVLFMLPAKLLMGTAYGYSQRRSQSRHWSLRWTAWGFEVAGVLVYVGALYLAQFVAWQGAFVMYFQHAVLVPAPLISS